MSLLEASPATVDDVSKTAAIAARTAPVELSERAVVDRVIAEVLAGHPDGGWVDSLVIADALFTRRVRAGGDPSSDQTRDYTQHLLRETGSNVCRHADGHHYRIHADDECGPSCSTKWDRRQAAPARGHCSFCFLEVTTAGDCPIGC